MFVVAAYGGQIRAWTHEKMWKRKTAKDGVREGSRRRAWLGHSCKRQKG
jgi:hypothetical protein